MRFRLIVPLASLCLALCCAVAHADAPRTIAFQGTLKDGSGHLLSGPQSVTFSLYANQSDATSVWSETQTVTAANGLFAVPLGSVTTFASKNITFSQPYWVGVKVGTDPEMMPRVPLQSVPYALAMPNIVMDSNGKIGLGGTPIFERLTVMGIKSSTGPSDDLVSEWIALANPVTGKTWHINGIGGRVNFAESNVADYRLYLSPGGSVGIGTGTPDSSYKLDVAGSVIFRGADLCLRGRGGGAGNNGGLGRALVDIGLQGLQINYGNDFGRVSIDGVVNFSGAVNMPTLTLTSSRRYKRDVQPLRNALDTLSRLQGVSYTWDAQHGGGRDIGFIAEDFGQVLPQLVAWEPNGRDAKGLDYSHLTALTVEGIKELKSENDTLKASLSEKDAQIAALNARLERVERLVEGKR